MKSGISIRARSILCATGLALLGTLACAPEARAAFVQSNYAVPQSPTSTVSVTYTAAQTAGDLNVVIIGWYDTTSHVLSVTDTQGNGYAPALSPTTQAVAGTQVIYYAANIGSSTAGANQLTVTFDAAVSYPDVRIAEYSGIATSSPLDVTAAGAGNSATSSAGPATTTNASDLLVAGNYVATHTTGAGAGFTGRIFTVPDGSILEDSVTSTAGSYTATASLVSAPWIMQMVAFKAAASGGSPPTAPTNLAATAASSSQINLTWTASTGGSGGVTGYRVERCQGSGCSSFAQVGTTSGTAYTDTGLAASSSYSYRVRAADAAGNLSAYSGTATATTQALPPPTAPTNLAASAVSSSQISLTWAASTGGNGGVSGYRVERCQGSGCSSFAQVGTTAATTYGDAGLTAWTSYSYRVRAADAAGNLSPYSGTASATTQAAPPLSYVQGNNAVPSTPQTTVSVTYGAAQTAGDLNVVAIGWYNTTSNVLSVTDTAGNTYRLGAGPTTQAQAGTQSIYYAAGIGAAAAGNRVTVTFDSAVPYPDVRIAEYAGVDPGTPVDAGAVGTGIGTVSTTAAFATTNANDVLVAANYVTSRSTAAGGGFTARVITVPDGSILEDRIVTTAGTYSAQAQLTQGSWIIQAIAFRGATAPVDTSAPTVSVTAPSPGATLSGTVTFTATASANGSSGLGGVQFQVDGVNVGPADTTAPFSLNFNTAQFANATHTITAYAWSGAHVVATSAPVSVSFSNASPGNPAQTGLWSGPFSWPLVSIHLNLLSDGRVLAWDHFAIGNPIPQVWDPVTSGFTAVQTNDNDNLFCSSHVTLADGRLFVPGGEVFAGTGMTHDFYGLKSAHIFDPLTNQWTSAAPMSYGRWYPNATTMADGRIFVTSGENGCFGCQATIPEIYDRTANTWTQIGTASLNIPWYPYNFVLPDGRILAAGSAESPMATSAYDPVSKTWSTVDARTLDGGSAAMYLPGKIIKAGTSSSTEGSTTTSSAITYMLDMTAPSPAWQQIASMAFPRTYHVMTVLPDGTVLVTGGGRTTGVVDIANAVYQAEVWSPATQTWSTLSSMSTPRLYHQTATLLPDGRVLVTGSGRGLGRADPTDQLSAELFAPPYLFQGPRPVITSAPAQLSLGQVFAIQTPDAARIAKVVLIRTGGVTHTFNMDQRYVPLTFTSGSGSLSVTAPSSANLAPPGFYMLFLVDTSGVPSVAKIVRF